MADPVTALAEAVQSLPEDLEPGIVGHEWEKALIAALRERGWRVMQWAIGDDEGEVTTEAGRKFGDEARR